MAKKSRVQGRKSPAGTKTATTGKASGITKYIPLVILAAIAFFAIQTYLMKKAEEARVLVFQDQGRQAERGTSDGNVMGCYDQATDKDRNFYILDEQESAFGNVRVQKFSPENKFLAVFHPKKSAETMASGRFLAVNSEGQVFVREAGGGICRLSSDLKFEKRWGRGMENTLALAIDFQDRLVTADVIGNGLLFLDADGKDLGRITLKKDTVASTARILALKDGRFALLSGDGEKPTLRIVNKDGGLDKKFEVRDMPFNAYNYIGADAQDRVYINDPVGRVGVAVYEPSGKYVGANKTTDTNIDFMALGGLCVSPVDGTIYANTVLGIVKMKLQPKK